MGHHQMEEKAAMSSFIPLLLFALAGLAIAVITSSTLLIPEAHDLIQEYKNGSILSKSVRDSCIICDDDSTGFIYSNFECRHGHIHCYFSKANAHASLLDFAELLRHPFNKGFDNKDYNFGTFEKAESFIKAREVELLDYPNTWISISTAGICLGSIQLILSFIGFIFWVKYHNNRTPLLLQFCICISSVLFMSTLIIFTLAMVWKINYSCPGVAYKSKFGCEYNDTSPKTHGRALSGFLGTNMVVWFISIIIFVRDIRAMKK